MRDKEKSFISGVVYLHNDSDSAVKFFDAIDQVLNEHFETYELIVVNDASTDESVAKIKAWAQDHDCTLTLINMSRFHGREDAMNAGIDTAIGDYVYEFDSVQMPYAPSLIYDAYERAVEGNDIVCVCPKHMRFGSRLFYKVFNDNSKTKYQLQTDVFRLVTRRAINRAHASSSYMPYRKAAYAASGLSMVAMSFEGQTRDEKLGRASLAIDSLALYTNAGFKISIGVTAFMSVVAFLALLYTVITYLIGKPIEGWTTLMLVMTFGFLGLFVILSILIKYASLNIDMTFRRQKYLIESVEKINN